jgi:nanoRNase/pAp phosphatase (c-di-AMP/oligoRNAs hydrolase)
MSIQEIESLIEKVEAKSILVLCHQNADPDALCSAFVISRLLKRLKPEVKVVIASPKGVSRLSKAICDYLPIKLTSEEPDFKDADLIVMADTNTILQLGEWSKRISEVSPPLVIVDHHANHPETERMATLYICDEDSSSTCEIVYSFFKKIGVTPSREEAEALFLGIAFDTKHFILAKSNTFKTAADLVDAGVNAEEALLRLSLPMTTSERIARLKACRRLKLVRINDWLVAFSHVKSYQASASRALVEMGANVAMVGGQRNDSLRISIRSDREFYTRTGFHLGRDLARPLGTHLNGMGGGHSTAAGMNGIGDFEVATKRAIMILREKLGRNLLKSFHKERKLS